MDQNIKTQWLTDLRSGEFKQCQGRLADGTGYCCLGVLAERAVEANVVSKKQGARRTVYYGRRHETLDERIQDWAGLAAASPVLPINSMYSFNVSLAELNDEGFTFPQIADLIERFL